MLFRQFSNIYVRVVGKMQDQYFDVLLFSNTGDKVHKIGKTTGHIGQLLSTRIRTLSLGLDNNTGIFQTTLIYVAMLKHSWNNISINGCSPIQGTSFKFLLTFYDVWTSECNMNAFRRGNYIVWNCFPLSTNMLLKTRHGSPVRWRPFPMLLHE